MICQRNQSAVEVFPCCQELQLWKHQSPQFIRAALINIAMGSRWNWGQHWKWQAIQAQTSKSEAKDRWHGIKRARWGAVMEAQSSCWYRAFRKAALATSAVSPPSTQAVPPQPGSATSCYQESKCSWAVFCLSGSNSACRLPSTSWPCSCARFPMLGFVPSTPERKWLQTCRLNCFLSQVCWPDFLLPVNLFRLVALFLQTWSS